MDRKATSDHIKEILELARNVAFASGIVAVLGTLVYQPESYGLHQHAKFVGGLVAIIGVMYIALSVVQYELRYPVTIAKGWLRYFLWFARFMVLVFLCEGSFIAVAKRTDWMQTQAILSKNGSAR